MIVEGDSEGDEDDWLSDRRLRESRKREVKEEKSNDDVVVYDFEKESYPGNMNAEENEMTCGTCFNLEECDLPISLTSLLNIYIRRNVFV